MLPSMPSAASITWKVNSLGSYLGHDAILRATALRTEEVKVPEWADPETGADVVLVRELRGRERDEFEASLAVQRGKQVVPDTANMRAKLVARSVVGDDGEPLFSQQDVAALGELSAAALNRVAEVASRLSGLREEDLEEMAGNSAAADGGASVSLSPVTSDAPSPSSSTGPGPES